MSHQQTQPSVFPCVPDLTVGTLHDIAGGRLRHADEPALDGDLAPVGRIVGDARAIEPGDVFWAVEQSSDSHGTAEYAYEALMRGACGVVTDRAVEPWCGRWSLTVADATLARMTLAIWNRARFTGRTIAVTGSVGKSTTLRMIEAILRTRLTGIALESGARGQGPGIGEDLVSGVLGLDPLDDFALFEAAAPAVGELANICRPEIGVITNLADAQWGSFATRLAVAEAHARLLAELPTGGVAVLPGDDLWVRRFAARCPARTMWFGRSGDCDVCATDVECRGEALRFTVDGVRMSVPVWGRQHLGCALAAYAVGRLMNFLPDEIADALADFRPLPHRCNVAGVAARAFEVRSEYNTATTLDIAARRWEGLVTLIDDSCTASPAASRAALQLLRDFDAPGRRIAVLGDLNVAEDSLAAVHRQVGDEVVSLCGADLLVACGDHAEDIVAGALTAGMPARRALAVSKATDATHFLTSEIAPGDVLLVKGRPRFPIDQLIKHFTNQTRAA